jgi:hypothetical protein
MRAERPEPDGPPPPSPAAPPRRSRGRRGPAAAVAEREQGPAGAAPQEAAPERADRRSSWPTEVERAAARVSAARGPDAEDESGDAGVLLRRDAALGGIEAQLSRRLKRVLADEENDVLDLLRRGIPESVDEVLPDRDAHVAAYASVAAPQLDAAASEGVALVGGRGAGSAGALAEQLGAALVEPLRARVTRSVDDGGDADEVTSRLRALYREWKGQRIGNEVRHYAAAAYAVGALDGATDGAEVRWLVDRTGEPCPDADDNALAGTVRKGEAFPTGDRCPPAHPGCRCLVVPAAGVMPPPGPAGAG